jgi:ATP-dependent DNA ligase
LYLGREAGELRFAGTAFLTLAGKPRDELQKRIEKLLTTKPPVPQRTWRKPQWVKPELLVRVRHLAGGDTLRHASVQSRVFEAKAAVATGKEATQGAGLRRLFRTGENIRCSNRTVGNLRTYTLERSPWP